jgi:hypothetical protein
MKRVLAILLFYIMIPFVSFSQDFSHLVVGGKFYQHPSTLEGMVEAVKEMSANKAPKKQIASWITRILDDRISNINSPERLLDPRLSISSEGDKLHNEYEAATIKDNKVIANWTWNNQMGTCQDLANTVYYILNEAGVPKDFRILDKGRHQFTVWGLAPDADATNPDTWGPNAIVPDPWTGRTADSDDVKSGFWYLNDDPELGLTDETKKYDINSIDLLRKEIEERKAEKNEILEKGINNHASIKFEFKLIDFLLSQYNAVNNYETRTSNLVDLGEYVCDEATNLRTKIFDLSKVMKDGEAIINTKINQANARANCTTPEDNIFVKTSYQEAKQAFAISKKAKESASNYFKSIEIQLVQIKRFNAVLDSSYTSIKNNSLVTDNEWHKTASERLLLIPDPLEQLKSGIEKEKANSKKSLILKKKIELSKKYYIQSFPKYETKFNQLISEIESIASIHYIVNNTQLSDLQDKYNRLQEALLYSPKARKNRDQVKIKHYAINCFSIESTKKEKDKIEEVFFRELLLIKDNEHLSAGCVPAATEETQEVATATLSTADSGIDPPCTVTATDSIATKTSDKSVFGGLTIAGPSQIIVGQGAQFIALDGAGAPYPNEGSFEWLNTREGLMVLSGSGMMALALGLKPGKATIILKYDGMTEYKEIKIVEMEKVSLSTSKDDEDINSIGTTGGEVNDEEDTDYIGTTGGEVSEDNELQEQCSEIVDRILIFLNSFDVDNARTYTNKALALSCDVNTGAVYALIAQIENIKKEEQEEWEQQYADQNIQKKSDAERSQKRNQNFNEIMNLLGEKFTAFSDSNERQRQERNARNNANFEKSQQKIKDYLANTKNPGIVDPNHVQYSYKPPPKEDIYVSIGGPSNGMSSTDCDKKFCPICHEGETQLDFLGVQVNSQCNKCRKDNKAKINDCIKGGSAANSPDRKLDEFDKYNVYKCTWTWYDTNGVSHHEIFYDYSGPEYKGKRKGSCTNKFRGTAHECYWKAGELNTQYGTVNHLVLPPVNK